MNEKFYALPKEKQDRIINAGFRVFSKNSYRKSPMNEIALEAGISKSLLFFYFKNKKELYLFLWAKVEEITLETLKKHQNPKEADIFSTMYESLVLKTEILKTYPDIMKFAFRVYYEDDPEVKDDVRKRVEPYLTMHGNRTMPSLNPADFRDGIDLKKMYRHIWLTSEGYIWQIMRSGNIDAERVVRDCKEMTDFWKSVFLK